VVRQSLAIAPEQPNTRTFMTNPLPVANAAVRCRKWQHPWREGPDPGKVSG